MLDLSGNANVPRSFGALDPRLIASTTAGLSAALDRPIGLDDRGLVDAIRALEQLGCVLTAAQAKLAVELEALRREEQTSHGLAGQQQVRGVAHELAYARRESPHRGQRHLGLAKAVISEMPATWSAWRAGHITEWKATLLARETACLSPEDRLAVDEKVAQNAERLATMSVRQVVAVAQAQATRLDPAAVVKRRRLAERERRVTLRPAPDSMTWLTALLPVKDGVAAYAALRRAAVTARAAGDIRGAGQVMADALVGRVLESDAAEAGHARVALNLVMTDHHLFGHSDEQAHLDGYGPIPGELARELVSGACDRGEQVWLSRLYAHPRTGELVATDSHSRLFRGSLARFIRLRDQFCRTPWCDAPVRHLDHPVPKGSSGGTSALNGQGLCESCNYAKEATGWRARPSCVENEHEVETTLPSGHRYRSRPPPVVATIRTTPIRIHYTLVS